MYKPEGYTDLSPYLVVADADACLAFIRAVFGTDPLRDHRRDDGTLMHGEIRAGDTVVMIGQATDAPADSAPVHLHVYMPDPRAAFARALAAGGREVQPLQVKDDGDLRGGVQAPCGTTWWLARAAP